VHKGIKATREGLEGQKTSCGWKINDNVPYVALPSEAALRQLVMIHYNNKTAVAIVMDVGPWNENDDEYVFGDARPQAESGLDSFGRSTNGAGIDLGEKIRELLDIKTDNVIVDWQFYATLGE
jgi:hypothetical protein